MSIEIFISHHHYEAGELEKEIKNPFKYYYDINVFLAHVDIKTGSDFVKTIEKEIESCDVFFYIGTAESNKSIFCQQELGMAKGLAKKIILSHKEDGKNSAKGFFEYIQSQSFKNYESLFETILQKKLMKEIFLKKVKEKIKEKAKDELHFFEVIDHDNFNDYDYYTRVILKNPYDNNEIYCRIAYKGQQDEGKDAISSKLPKKLQFPYLSNNFFCHIIDDDVSDEVRALLNDVSVLSTENFKKIENEEVLAVSLFRDYGKKLSELKEKHKK